VLLRKLAKDYDNGNRGEAIEYLRARQRAGEIVTGLLYIDESQPDLHGVNGTTATPLNQLPYEHLCPGPDALAALQKRFR
jgi:2-oxoglutarate ferredoxin oxidoreductase subunit beta